MAILYVTEYQALADDARDLPMPIPGEPSVADQTVTFTTSTASNAFNELTTYVRVLSDADAHVKFGETPVATTSHQWIAANTEYFRAVKQGQKVAAVTA
jgi:hypothetical protein